MLSNTLRRWSAAFLAVLLTAFFVGLAVHTVWTDLGAPRWGADDAQIFFVYARNMVAGHGIVYSVGGPHVEGASSFLYLLICWLAWLLFSNPNIALLYLNSTWILLSCMLLRTLFRRLEGFFALPRYCSILLYLAFFYWLCSNPSFFFWDAVSLMDSETFSLLIVSAFALLAFELIEEESSLRTATFCLLISLTVLARPEGMGWGLLESITFMLIRFKRSQKRAKRMVLALPAAAFVATLGVLITFRELYFGHALPTTYYAKVSHDHLATLIDGIKYAKSVIIDQYRPGLLVPLIIGYGVLVYLCVSHRERSTYIKLLALTLTFSTTAFFIPILEGGDHFDGARLYQPAYPINCFLAVIVALPAFRRGNKSGYVALALVALVCGIMTQNPWTAFRQGNTKSGTWPFDGVKGVRVETEIAKYETANGYLLNKLFSPKLPSIGVIAAGGVAYSYRGPVDDLIGLNDEQMARADAIKVGPKGHASFNQEVFYLRSPQVVLPVAFEKSRASDFEAQYMTNLSPHSPANTMLKEIYSTRRFQSQYQLAILRQTAAPWIACYAYFRRDYLRSLTESGMFLVEQP